jgi:hypothetical protein
MALGSTQPQTRVTRNLPGGKVRPGRKADNRHLWADCLYNVESSMSQTLWASRACYKDSFTFVRALFYIKLKVAIVGEEF